MFARDKRIGPYTYVYLVENVREDGRTRQRIIANLGRKEAVLRTPTSGVAGKLFQAVGVALPPNLQELPLTTPQPAA
jgi:hypothetical protein